MWLVIEDHDNLFVMAELVHFLGIGLLAWKLMKKKNAGGVSTSYLDMHANGPHGYAQHWTGQDLHARQMRPRTTVLRPCIPCRRAFIADTGADHGFPGC